MEWLWRLGSLLVLVGMGLGLGPATRADGPRVLQVATLAKAGRLTPGYEVAAGEAAWRSLWSQLMGVGPAPTVNWERQFVVGAFLGQRPTGGYAIEVTSIELRGSEIAVRVRVRRPEPGSLVSMAFTYPGHVVAAERPPSGRYTVLVYDSGGHLEARMTVQL